MTCQKGRSDESRKLKNNQIIKGNSSKQEAGIWYNLLSCQGQQQKTLWWISRKIWIETYTYPNWNNDLLMRPTSIHITSLIKKTVFRRYILAFMLACIRQAALGHWQVTLYVITSNIAKEFEKGSLRRLWNQILPFIHMFRKIITTMK